MDKNLRDQFRQILYLSRDEEDLTQSQKLTLDNLVIAARPQPLGPPTPMESMPETHAKHLTVAQGSVTSILEVLANAAPDREAIFPVQAVKNLVNAYLRITREQQ